MSDTYDLADPIRLALDVTVNGVGVVPTTIALTVQLPDGSTAPVVPAAIGAVGHYEATYTPPVGGAYIARWVVTGSGAGAEAYAFTVLPAFAVRYASVAEVRAAGASSSVSDAAVNGAISAAKELIDRYTQDTFATVNLTVRALMANGLAPLPLRVQAVTQIAYADIAGGGSVLPATSYSLRSSATYGDIDAIQLLGYGVLSAALLDITYEPVRSNDFAADGERAVNVTGTFGWVTVPNAVHDAAVELALANLPGGGANVNTEGDSALGVAPTTPMLRRTPSSTGSLWADELLRPYMRRRVRVT